MCWIATTYKPGASFGSVGKFFYTKPNPSSADLVEVALPSGVNVVDDRPCFAFSNVNAKSRLYITNGFTDNLVFTENFELMRQGILPPPNPFVNGVGASNSIGAAAAAGPGVTGSAICYVSWWDDHNKRRSPLSGPSPTFALVNQSRAWTNLPTQPNDPSVTHIELWVSMDGALPRLAVRRDLGTTTCTENIATGALGEAFTDDFGRFPRCRFNVSWHDRQVLGGDDRHPDRLYLSLLEEYERYGGFYLRTRNGERIVGLIALRDHLIVLTPVSSYVVTGYTEDDIKMDMLEPAIGGISHFTNVNAGDYAIVPSKQGWFLCTGSGFHPIGLEFASTWRQEFKKGDSLAKRALGKSWEKIAWAVNDTSEHVVKLYVGSANYPAALAFGEEDALTSALNMYWVIDYSNVLPEEGGGFGQAALMFDLRTRADECAAMMAKPGGRMEALYTGSADGIIRQENVGFPYLQQQDGDASPNLDDDGDAFQKELIVSLGHYVPDDIGGGTVDDGYTFQHAWAFADIQQPGTVKWYPGEETGNLRLAAPFSEAIPDYQAGVSARLDTDGGTLTDRASFNWDPRASGRGISFQFRWPLASGSFYGFGYRFGPGPAEPRTQTPFAGSPV